MAKSFHTILNGNGSFEIDHQGETATLELPQVLKDLNGILMNKEALAEWIEVYEIELGVYHTAIQKIIIDVRAKARPAIDKDGNTKSIVTELESVQKRIDDFVIKPTLPPGSSTPKAFGKGEESALKAAIEALKMAAMTDETIVDILGVKFDQAKVQAVLDSLED